MTTFDKLKHKIKIELNMDLFDFKRRYVGYWQRSAGAWVWVAKLRYDDGRISVHDYGSCLSATDLLKSKRKLDILGQEILIN